MPTDCEPRAQYINLFLPFFFTFALVGRSGSRSSTPVRGLFSLIRC